MLRAIWARVMLMLFGVSIGLTDKERADEAARMRERHPDLFRDER